MFVKLAVTNLTRSFTAVFIGSISGRLFKPHNLFLFVNFAVFESLKVEFEIQQLRNSGSKSAIFNSRTLSSLYNRFETVLVSNLISSLT